MVKHYSNEYPREKTIDKIEDDIECDKCKDKIYNSIGKRVLKKTFNIYLAFITAILTGLMACVGFLYVKIIDYKDDIADIKTSMQEIQTNVEWLKELRQGAGSNEDFISLVKNYGK